MFESVLVANRGEIAVRIIRTLRRLGIRSVVVASIPDRHSLSVRSADDWVLLEGSSSAESYLDIEAVIAAARLKGCGAVHPGYGFLSERPDFAERCAVEGLVFIGPPVEVLRAMGDKGAARRLAVEHGIPVVPGWDGDDDEPTLLREAARIGAPLMVKAKGGGGGRGMREVFDLTALPEVLASARREAQSAFGDPRLLLERLVVGAHHVEVQVMADKYGHILHLGERDCSVQRRHQKLIEETPSPVVDDALREQLTGAALKLAHTIRYVNAGTFEFLVGAPGPDANRPFYFLEVNPRLQVEHPVTEQVSGLDLVELQLRVAAGEALPLRQSDVRLDGHAIEFRINAEDPWDDFRPGTGRLEAASIEVTRMDAGFEAGDTIPAQYDSLIAKAVVCGHDRAAALSLAQQALVPGESLGVATNLGLHAAIVRSPAFVAGEASVDWLERNLESLLNEGTAPLAWWAAAAAALLEPTKAGSPATDAPARALGWVGAGGSCCWLDDGAGRKAVRLLVTALGDGTAAVDGQEIALNLSSNGVIHVDGQGQGLIAHRSGSVVLVSAPGGDSHEFRIVSPPPLPRRARTTTSGAIAVTAPLAGTISAVSVAEGDAVEEGALLVLLEAMKMEHRIVAPAAGIVQSTAVRERDVVADGDLLVELA